MIYKFKIKEEFINTFSINDEIYFNSNIPDIKVLFIVFVTKECSFQCLNEETAVKFMNYLLN
jgi:hypothetical protein